MADQGAAEMPGGGSSLAYFIDRLFAATQISGSVCESLCFFEEDASRIHICYSGMKDAIFNKIGSFNDGETEEKFDLGDLCVNK
jgi:hypothetical protein